MKITIIGAGVMGLSTAWAATRAGHNVTIVEQGAIPNEAGSSADETRLIRHAYGAMDGYARLVDPAFAAWDRLWDSLGTSYYRTTGTLCLTDGGSPWFSASAAGLEALGKPVEWLDIRSLAARFPVLTIREGAQAFIVPTGGVLQARAILRATAKWLAANGAVLRTDTAVSAIDPETAACDLTEGGTLTADRLVVAAGPWTPSLLGSGMDLTPTRQVTAMAEVPSVHADAWAAMPMVLDIGQDSGSYIVPPADAGLLKLGSHRFTGPGNPNDDRLMGRAEGEAVFEECAHWLRSPELYRLSNARACYYTLAPNERFIVRPLAEKCWAMAGFSGHGFKFGPLLGEQLTAALDGTQSAEQVTHLAAGDTA